MTPDLVGARLTRSVSSQVLLVSGTQAGDRHTQHPNRAPGPHGTLLQVPGHLLYRLPAGQVQANEPLHQGQGVAHLHGQLWNDYRHGVRVQVHQHLRDGDPDHLLSHRGHDLLQDVRGVRVPDQDGDRLLGLLCIQQLHE